MAPCLHQHFEKPTPALMGLLSLGGPFSSAGYGHRRPPGGLTPPSHSQRNTKYAGHSDLAGLARDVTEIAQASSDVMCLSPKPGMFSRLQFIHRFNYGKRGNGWEKQTEQIEQIEQIDLPICLEGRGIRGIRGPRFSALAALSLVWPSCVPACRGRVGGRRRRSGRDSQETARAGGV
jgi:hypothetical protein